MFREGVRKYCRENTVNNIDWNKRLKLQQILLTKYNMEIGISQLNNI